jgi:hypothetical protein
MKAITAALLILASDLTIHFALGASSPDWVACYRMAGCRRSRLMHHTEARRRRPRTI